MQLGIFIWNWDILVGMDNISFGVGTFSLELRFSRWNWTNSIWNWDFLVVNAKISYEIRMFPFEIGKISFQISELRSVKVLPSSCGRNVHVFGAIGIYDVILMERCRVRQTQMANGYWVLLKNDRKWYWGVSYFFATMHPVTDDCSLHFMIVLLNY